ncbi:hypothetical protein [Dactylosporangium sp. NPDC049140]|uniref:hypothetical protein n=1 Tax=Dactylosporangium sp. NPDC049140 TaxID=3155647 RepID=UPI0033F6B710
MKRDEFAEGRLGELLSAAAAPGRRHELLGEPDAVATFRREYRPRIARPRKRRIFAVAVAAVLAAGVGGTAFAANTGLLPDPVQTWFDKHTDLKPDNHDTAPVSTMSAPQSPQPPRASAATSAAAGPTPLEACRAWVARRTDPHARPVTGDERKALSLLAGGERAIDAYCDRLLGLAPSSSAAAPPSGKSGKSSKSSKSSNGSNGKSPGGNR